MSKKSTARMRSAERSSVEVLLDRVAGWLGQRSRLMRSFLAALIAISLVGALGLIFYSILLSTSPGSFTYYLLTRVDILTITFIVLVALGIGLYWLGWRLLIGFDLGDAPVQPGRRAAIWLIVGMAVFVSTLCLVAVSLIGALQ